MILSASRRNVIINLNVAAILVEMKEFIFTLGILLICGLTIISCTPKKSKSRHIESASPTQAVKQNYDWLSSKVTIPQYVIDSATQYRSGFLTKNSESASNITFTFFYNDNGDACLEATVNPKENYTWEKETWICQWWGEATGEIGLGEIKYTQTKKKLDEAEFRIETRRQDPVFVKIEKIVLKLATEYDYDYMGAYGITAKYRNPKIKKAFCEGYSNATEQAFAKHPLVDHVENYAGGNHEWNIIVLKDKRKLYTDVTWYDGNSIDDDGYVVNVPVRNPVNLTFDLAEFNSLGGAIDISTGQPVKVHFDFADARKVN